MSGRKKWKMRRLFGKSESRLSYAAIFIDWGGTATLRMTRLKKELVAAR
jgi:hypothetical protein